jgi:hypothetical protein
MANAITSVMASASETKAMGLVLVEPVGCKLDMKKAWVLFPCLAAHTERNPFPFAQINSVVTHLLRSPGACLSEDPAAPAAFHHASALWVFLSPSFVWRQAADPPSLEASRHASQITSPGIRHFA